MKGIEIPPGDVTKMPVIGEALIGGIKFVMKGDTHTFEDKWEDVVAIVEDGAIYVINKWYKPGVPQIRHKNLVKEYRQKTQES